VGSGFSRIGPPKGGPHIHFAKRVLASRIGGVSATDAGSPKELPERKAGDQRAASNAGCEENQFFSDDLHSNSCCGGDEGGGPLLSLGCAVSIGLVGGSD